MMRAAALILLALLAGCDSRYGTANGTDLRDPEVYLDRDTGCEYLTTHHDVGLMPRVDRNGKHVCRNTP